uniref:Cytochrome P450 n=1 Tax=Rhabditophanes sp. KR3021 TaxID=114890 RepID=A0AC35TMC7_9BILA
MVDLHEYFYEQSKPFNGVCTLFIPTPVVILCTYDAIKEALITKGEFTTGRNEGYPEKLLVNLQGGKGLLLSDGPRWRTLRRITLHALRDFGMGKKLMEERVNINIEKMFEFIDKIKDEEVNFDRPIQTCISNIISNILFGISISDDSTETNEFKKSIALLDIAINRLRRDKKLHLFSLFDGHPWILNVLEKTVKVDGLKEYGQFLDKLNEITMSTAKTWVKNSEASNLVHYYLNASESLEEKINSAELCQIASDMLTAGFETTTTLLLHALNYLGANLDKQEFMRNEIFNVIGFDNIIKMNDKASLPYCSAVLMEIMRCSNVIPFNVFHRATEDIVIQGKLIPKDTTIMPHIFSVMKYDKDFVDSDKFMPERWLNENMKTFKKELGEKLVPFSLGKRQCAGEGLAVMELFLVLTRLIQRYKIAPPPGKPKPDTKPIFGDVLKAAAYEFQVIDV